MNHEKLAELIDDFARKTEVEFTLSDLAAYVQEKGVKASEAELYDHASFSDYLLEVDPLDEVFLSRRTFFKGAQFRVNPLEAEVEGGYLMPGHRFMPFLADEVFPGAIQLFLSDGSVVPSRKISLPQSQTMAGLHFYGPPGAFEYLLYDDAGNMSSLMPPFEAEVLMSVFDLSNFFALSDFRPGDSIMFTVKDWLLGEFEMARAEPALDAVVAKKWMTSMAVGLNVAIDDFGSEVDCNFQLAIVMQHAQEDSECVSLMSNPPLSLAAYFNLQKDHAVKMVGDRALFWPVDEEPMEDALWDALEDPEEPESELDVLFQDVGLSITEGEVEAYMRDALFLNEGKNADGVLAQITMGRHLLFASAADQERFHQLWNALWDEVAADYDLDNDSCGKIRSRFIMLNDRILVTVRRLDAQGVSMEVIKNPAFLELNRLSSMVSSALVIFNNGKDGGEVSLSEVENLIPTLEEAVDDLSGRLFGQDASKKLVEKKSANAEKTKIYQLKITLKGSNPPIWRRILIPTDMELIDLHGAIQTAMGWGNYHLHQFKQDNIFYQPDSDDEFSGFGGFETEDSSGVRIDDLLLKEKQKIQYEYDFGDSWEHEVLLEKVLEPDANVPYPVCVKGKGACPPEDCGGLWGYYNLLEVLGDPEDDEHESMLEWTGGPIDPAAFDLEETNARIRALFG